MYVQEYLKQEQNRDVKGGSLNVARGRGKSSVKNDTLDPRREQYLKDMNYVSELLERRAEFNTSHEEDGKEKVMPIDSNHMVLDLMAEKQNKGLKDVARRCFVA